MRKLKDYSVWIALGLLGLLGIWLFFDLRKPVREPGDSPKVSDLLGVKTDDVQRFEIARKGASLVVARKGSGWVVEQPIKADADADAVKQALDGVLDITTDYIMEDPPKDLKPYGLVEPEVVLAVTAKDGRRAVLQFGGKDPGKYSNFTREPDSGRIFLVSSAGVETLRTKDAEALRDKTLITTDPEKVERITIRSAGQVLTVAKSGEKWEMLEPWKAPADEGTVSSLKEALRSIKAARFIATGAQPAAYGLDAPAVTVEVAQKGGERKVFVIGRKDGADYAAARKGSTDILALTAANFASINKKPGEMRAKKMLDFATDAVERLAVRGPKGSWEVTRKGEDYVFVSPNAGKKAGKFDVEDVLWDMTGTAASHVAENATDLRLYGLDNPPLILTATLKGAVKKELRVGSKTAKNEYYAQGTDAASAIFTVADTVFTRASKVPPLAK